ncbi:MAG: hypothetical protein V2B18_15810 [Pseudomonadota bacterium]
MADNNRSYRAVFSSDWSECLSPNGPFDPISFLCPELAGEPADIFRRYTGNEIPLAAAWESIRALVPAPITMEGMDAYLEAEFKTYSGVRELIEWCDAHDVFVMINTTGSKGYFQRALAKNLLPHVPAVSANPLISFGQCGDDGRFACEVHEIDDKPRCTSSVLQSLGIPASKLVIMGDSGGDGPHFEWGASVGAVLVASMPKASLLKFCSDKGVSINRLFGVVYGPGEVRRLDEELSVDFMALREIIESVST